MPELPEVEVVRAGLAPAVTGAVVERVEVLDGRSLKRHRGPAEDFVARLVGARLTEPRRRGKFLWIPLDPTSPGPPGSFVPSVLQDTPPVVQEFLPGERASGGAAPGSPAERPAAPAERPAAPADQPGEVLMVHLGMSGQVLLRARDADRDRLTRIVLDVRHPRHGPLRVDFVDQRIFGSMAVDELVPAGDVPLGSGPGDRIPSQVAHIARDPLDPLFDDARFFRALARRNTGIKRALLDQTLISGIGNIYADEALWASRIHYEQPTAALSRARAALLLAEVRSVLVKALAEGGTSFDAQYVNVNGASGYFSHSLNAYGQTGLPCPRCGRPIVRDSFMNRGSHFCAFCQRVRMPRPA